VKSWPARIRWTFAAFLTLYSFFGTSSPLGWLTTPKGRLLVLLAALAIAFWPQLVVELRKIVLRVRPVGKRELRRETQRTVEALHAYRHGHPPPSRVEQTSEWFQLTRAMTAAPDDSKRTDLWNQYNNRRTLEDEQRNVPFREALSAAPASSAPLGIGFACPEAPTMAHTHQ
jgi:hypothetical protein